SLRKRRIAASPRNVAMCHKETSAGAANLLDNLVGEYEQRRWNLKIKRHCRFLVDHELEFDRLLNREIGGLPPFEKTIDVVSRTAEDIHIVRAVRHQCAI